MKCINLNYLNLNFVEKFKGSNATIQKCEYEENLYIYKEFYNKNYLKKNISKINTLNKINLNCGIFPAYLVYDELNSEYSGYLTEYVKYNNALILKKNTDKITRLLKIKESIIKLHKEGIIHGDLHFGNILVDLNTYDNKIIDFDNCSYKRYKTKISYANDYAVEYIKHYGINQGLDIFLFNIMTYCILNNNLSYYLVRRDIYNKQYGVFDNQKCRKICDSFFLEDNCYCKEYLIDYIK